jgi:hypothetical protein
VKVRDIAEFRADFPDDSIEDKRGFIRYPGLGLAETVAQMCRDMGFHVPAPEGEAELGWVLDVHVGKRRYWLRLSDLGDRVILISRDVTRYEPTPGDIGHEELLRRIDAAMQADGRFSDVAWYTDAEYQRVDRGSAKQVRTGPPLPLRLRGVARTAIFICVILFLSGVSTVELWNGLVAFAGGQMAISGFHALAGIASAVFLFWGFPRLGAWLYSRGF